MDFQDFSPEPLYFEHPSLPEVTTLIDQAARCYLTGDAEPLLQQAYTLAPDDLTVLVALYRFYFYQHRPQESMVIAERAMGVVAPMIGFPRSWQLLRERHLAQGLSLSFTMVRFYLMALKGAALIQLRLGEREEGEAILKRVIALDEQDRLGAAALLATVQQFKAG